jgi:hypothetical protein
VDFLREMSRSEFGEARRKTAPLLLAMTSERRLRDFEKLSGLPCQRRKSTSATSSRLSGSTANASCGLAQLRITVRFHGVLGNHKDELKDYDISKGTVRFQADKAMPAALVKKLIKTRIAENVGRSNKAR